MYARRSRPSRRLKPALGNLGEFLDAIKECQDYLDGIEVDPELIDPRVNVIHPEVFTRARPLYNRLLRRKRVDADIRRSRTLYYGPPKCDVA